jgi:hypothetical protein
MVLWFSSACPALSSSEENGEAQSLTKDRKAVEGPPLLFSLGERNAKNPKKEKTELRLPSIEQKQLRCFQEIEER